MCVWGAVRVWECSRLGAACAKAQKQRGPKILGELGGEQSLLDQREFGE